MLTIRKLGLAAAVALIAAPFAATAADAPTPPKAFAQCKACHEIVQDKTKVGPSLFGVYGRKAGTLASFNFSDQHKASGLTWDEASLTKYLADPKATIPGNKMAFAGLKKPEDVAEVIAFLKALK